MNKIKKSILFLTLLSLLGTPVLRAMEEEKGEGLDKETLAQIEEMDRQSLEELPQFGTTIKLDPYIKAQFPRLIQLNVTYQQDSTTCGYRAASYAKVIDRLFNLNQDINSEIINSNADNYLSHAPIGGEELYYDQIRSFIADNLGNLNNYYFLGEQRFGGQEMCVLIPSDEDVTAEKDMYADLRNKLTQIKSSGFGCIHFICHQQGPHWVLLSLIKYRDRDPFFVYVDSKNGPLSVYNLVYRGFRELGEVCAPIFPCLYKEMAIPARNTHLMPMLVAASAAALLIFFRSC